MASSLSATASSRSRLTSEGTPHLHRIGTAKDKNGKYCGNLIDANLCVRINQEWPALMRGRNWPIDDLDVTDWTRMAYDDDYRRCVGGRVLRYDHPAVLPCYDTAIYK